MVQAMPDWKMFIAVGVDPVAQRIILIGCAETEEEAKGKFKRTDISPDEVANMDDLTYRRVFAFHDRHVGSNIRDWLMECGLVFEEAKQAAVDFLKLMMLMSEESRKSPECS
jgi:hypothetical protein